MKNSLYIIGLCCCTLLACEPDEAELNSAATLLGFGDQMGSVSVTGDTSEARILWTRATDRETRIEFTLEGEGVTDTDLRLLTPSPIVVPAGASETSIKFQIAEGEDEERLDKRGLIRLLEGDWYRLSTRDTFSFGYTVPHTAELELWAPDIPFPKLWGYTSFGPEPVPDCPRLCAGAHFTFGRQSTTQANVIGLFNTQVGKSTNAFNMHRLYTDYDVSSASANIRIPNALRLIPAEEGAVAGTVEVIEQRITITRKASSGLPPFTVGISGGGTYDETTGIITISVVFDESELGIAEPVVRQYSYESEER